MSGKDAKEEIRERISIVDLVSQYTKLIQSGNKFKGLSPFTNEKTPSFFVDPDKELFYCFSTQEGGDIFTFIQKAENMSFREALEMLAEKTGVSLSSNHKKEEIHSDLYSALERVSHMYQSQINDSVRSYLYSRGLKDKTINEWNIGYAKDTWNAICQLGMIEKEAYIKSGICVEKENSIYDRFRNRVIFPFFDVKGRVIAFSGRVFGDNSGAKYINSPETVLFHKSSFLFGLHIAKQYIRKNNFSILTEGPLDAIAIHQAGYPCAVATSGTSITVEHLESLQKLSNRVLIALDSDMAGLKATLRVLPIALFIGLDIKVVLFPKGSDPAELIKNDIDEFKNSIKNALSVSSFLYKYVLEKYGDDKEDISRGIREEALPIIKSISDSILLETIIKQMSEVSGISEKAIYETLDKIPIQEFQKTHYVYERKKNPSEDFRIKEKLEWMLLEISSGKSFLSSLDIQFPKDIKENLDIVESIENLPSVEENIAIMKYESDFPESKDRAELVIVGMRDILNRALPLLKKREEIKKLSK